MRYKVFLKHRNKLPENWRKRAEHFYNEKNRVKRGAELWANGDIEGFGKLINESGSSSINMYETGSPELKALYDALIECDGVYGARFSGAGFKGCCMALIAPKCKGEITKSITEQYLKQFPELKDSFSIHYCKTADGVIYR